MPSINSIFPFLRFENDLFNWSKICKPWY